MQYFNAQDRARNTPSTSLTLPSMLECSSGPGSLLPTPSANSPFSVLGPFCSSTAAMGDVALCLISRLQENQQRVSFPEERYAECRRQRLSTGQKAVTGFMEP